MSNGIPDSAFYWTFASPAGDQWTGVTVADEPYAELGQIFSSPYGPEYGTYTITDVFDYGAETGQPEGVTWVSSYFDPITGGVYQPYYYSQGLPGTLSGLGTEVDYVLVDGGWNDFGQGGYLLA